MGKACTRDFSMLCKLRFLLIPRQLSFSTFSLSELNVGSSSRTNSNTDISTEEHGSSDSNGQASCIRGRLHTNDNEREHYFNLIEIHLRLDNQEEVCKKQLGLLLKVSDSFTKFVEELKKRSNRTEGQVLSYLVRVRKNAIENGRENAIQDSQHSDV